MGQELEIELDISDKSSVDLSPNTVLPSHQHCLNVKKRCKKGNPTGKDEFLKLKEDFAEIKFARFRSSSCKNHPSRSHGLEGNIEIRQGSVYQSSSRSTDIKKMGTMEGRKKIEISCSRRSDASFSGSVVDSLCGSDDEDSEHRPSFISQSSSMTSPSVSSSWARIEQNSSDVFIDFFINSDGWHRNSNAVEGTDSINSKIRSDKVAGSPIDVNSTLQKDTVQALHKSLSAKVEVAHLLSPRQSDCSSRGSPTVPFNPIRKRLNDLNPFTKSKSLRNPPSRLMENAEVKSIGTNVTRNRTYRKSLLNDFSNTVKHSDIISEFINRDIQYSGIASSPVHLHGNLKMNNRHGLPSFEFRVKCPQDIYVAKIWRTGNAFKWVYTFHSIDNRKKSNATGLRSHDCEKDSSMVAQMVVSCNLCSKVEGGEIDNSMVTEFVLYDLTHSRRRVSCEKKSNSEQDVSRTCPLSYMELHPNLEIAAIVLRIPVQKRESLKYKREDMTDAKAYSKLSNLSSVVEHCRKSLHDRKMQEQVKVVLPTGNHGLPSVKSQGPSSLLDRWKHGGGCDCGGWDMACPLILLGNPSIQFAEDHILMKEYQPLELFLQGAKENNTPTFSMTIVEEGEYAVDFHAQLSPLQAFAICVAVLHGSSTFSSPRQERNLQLSQCSSLKMLIEEEAEFLIKSVATKESKTETVSKIHKGIPRPYVMNPPFSPIARV